MDYRQFYGFFVLVLAITSISGSRVPIDPKSNSVHLEPPNLGGYLHNNRPPLHPSSKVNGEENQVKLTSEIDIIKPCNGSYLKTNGTTCGLKEIMIGRCYEYQFVKRGLFLSDTNATKNCSELYELFETAVRYKPYCNMNMSTYEKYFQRALEDVTAINRAMLWSGTYRIAHIYSGHGYNYITLEDTLAAGMVDGLTWCGKENDTEGFDYVSCPNNCKDNQWADLAFWGHASQAFAERVSGEIYVVMNGSKAGDQPAFRSTSYFASFELPNFRREGPHRVTKITVLLLHSPDQKVVERCGEKSLILLEETIRNSSQIEYSCIDDPDELLLVMCGDEWGTRECQVARQALRKEWDKKVFGKSNANFHSTSILFFICLIINYFY